MLLDIHLLGWSLLAEILIILAVTWGGRLKWKI